MKRNSEAYNAGLQAPESSGIDEDALLASQIPGQVSSQSHLSLPEISSSDHIFSSREQVRITYSNYALRGHLGKRKSPVSFKYAFKICV